MTQTEDYNFCNGCKCQVLKTKKIFGEYVKDIPYCKKFNEWIYFDLKCRKCLTSDEYNKQ